MIVLSLGAGCPRVLRDNASEKSFADLFQLERPLCTATQGCCVYLARIRGSCERVVVKCLNKDTAPRDIHHQVEHEANMHLRLLHPHIVRCYAYLEDVTHKYLVVEYAEQGDLRKVLHSYKEEDLRDYVVQPVLQALRYMNTMGIVHRDLKPENIFLCGASVKLGDFGLAVRISDRDELPDTHVNNSNAHHHYDRYTAGGTPLYTAPEVLTAIFQNQSVDSTIGPKNDVWALALIVLEALARQHPFQSCCGGGYGHLLLSIVTHDAISIPHTVSSELRDWLTLALKKDPEQRASAEQLLQHAWMERDYSSGGVAGRSPPRLSCRPLEHMAAVTFLRTYSFED